jgi:hypothetical protein
MAKLSRVDFLEEVAHLVARRFPLVKLERNADEFSLRVNGHWTSLENLYRLSQQQPAQFERHVERWVTELLRAAEGSPDQTASFEEIKERILPMVIPPGPRDVVGQAMTTQPLLEGLSVAYALDSERTIAYIPRKVFDGWNVSLDELHEVAIANLVQRSQTLQAHAAQDDAERVTLILIQTMDG